MNKRQLVSMWIGVVAAVATGIGAIVIGARNGAPFEIVLFLPGVGLIWAMIALVTWALITTFK